MECLKPLYLHAHEIYVPCGKCPQCGANKRHDWATRLHYEARQHLCKQFVTLTYRNNKLRWAHGQSQIVRRDLQLWFKRLRKAGYALRYFAVGEYGSITYRPHYHVILFGSIPTSAMEYAWIDEGPKGTSLGHIHVGQVTEASIMYCLGYLVNAKAPLMAHHRVRPFSLMSRRPGIGAAYITPEMLEWHHSCRKNYTMVDGAQRHLPRYYKQKIFSKIDQVRIAVKASKDWFNKELAWSRAPHQMKLTYPQLRAYRREQQLRLAQAIRASSKSTQQI